MRERGLTQFWVYKSCYLSLSRRLIDISLMIDSGNFDLCEVQVTKFDADKVVFLP